MTRRRWIADEFTADSAALTGAHAAHLSRTLRARVGQQFEIACGEQVRQGTISSVSDGRVEFALGALVTSPDVVPITLLLAIFKFDRMEWAIEKCTELNVTAIVPVIARRTERHLAAAAEKRVERWRRIGREAAQQSRRVAPPEICDPMRLKDAIVACSSADEISSTASISHSTTTPNDHSLDREQALGQQSAPPEASRNELRRSETGFSPGREPRVGAHNELSRAGTAHLRVVLAENERGAMLTEALRPNLQSLSLAVGPEGGWTDDEVRDFVDSGWMTASLGETILRAETAAIAALAVVRATL